MHRIVDLGIGFCRFFVNMTGKAAQENAREVALASAMQEEMQRRTDPNESHEKSLIILGSKEVGKTTMIHRFLEKEESPKPTLAMDYSYGRKAGKSLIKDIVHVWEVGHLDSSLISAAMAGCSLTHSPHHTTILIMLDLGKPETLWNSLEDCLNALRNAMKSTYAYEVIEDVKERKIASLKERIKVDEDEPTIEDSFPMRLCIIGGKYDEFRELEGDDREFIGRVLRATAHILGATLHYYSAKDSQMLRKTKELLSLYGFKGQTTKVIATDYNKPLSMPAGNDTFASIDLTFSHGRYVSTLDTIKQIYVSRFPQKEKQMEEESNFTVKDPVDDETFKEPIIDRFRIQREQEISVLLRDMLESPATNIPIPEPY